MRIVESEKNLEQVITMCKNEAKKHFGDGSLLVEKLFFLFFFQSLGTFLVLVTSKFKSLGINMGIMFISVNESVVFSVIIKRFLKKPLVFVLVAYITSSFTSLLQRKNDYTTGLLNLQKLLNMKEQGL